MPEDFSADVVAFDLNSLLHSQLRRARDETHAIKLTFQKLHATLRCVRPERYVLLAIDGAGPMAKMATQQARRRKTSAKAAARRGLSPLLLTPGTQFMTHLEEALVYWSCSELSTQRGRGRGWQKPLARIYLMHRQPMAVGSPSPARTRRLCASGANPRSGSPCAGRHLRILISGADAPGEGEFKIMDWLLSQCEATAPGSGAGGRGAGGRGGGAGRPLRSAVLVGGDGDLVLQALSMQVAPPPRAPPPRRTPPGRPAAPSAPPLPIPKARMRRPARRRARCVASS